MELKTCPFCGDKAVIEPYKVRKGYEATIRCDICLVSLTTITHDNEQDAVSEAIKMWNRRVNETH